MEVVVIGEALVFGLFLIVSYRKGLCDGLRVSGGKSPEPILKKRDKHYSKAPVFDERTERILKNIDNYDGTSERQKAIE